MPTATLTKAKLQLLGAQDFSKEAFNIFVYIIFYRVINPTVNAQMTSLTSTDCCGLPT